MRRSVPVVVALSVGISVAGCSEERTLSDQDVRLHLIGVLADSPAIDDDEARCLGRVASESGGADLMRQVLKDAPDGDPEQLSIEDQITYAQTLVKILKDAADECGVPASDLQL